MNLLDQLYSHHFYLLKITSPTPNKIPTLKEQLKNNKTDETKKIKKNEDKNPDDRHVYFCVRYSKKNGPSQYT